MTNEDLEKVIAIAEEGSMARAAEKLYISPPALSKSLKRVEEELGEVLFVRAPSGLSLTFAGECFLKYAYQIKKMYEEMSMEFCELNQMKKGALRIGVTERMGALLLPQVLERFRKKYPNIQLDIVEKGGVDLEEMLAKGGLDMALVSLPLKYPSLPCHVFYEDPFLIAVPRTHPMNEVWKEKEALPVTALKGQELLLTRRFKKTRLIAEQILEPLNGDYRIITESYSIETIIRLAAENMGISLVPEIYAKAYDCGDRLQYYRIENCPVTWKWAVVFSSDPQNLTRPSKELYKILSLIHFPV